MTHPDINPTELPLLADATPTQWQVLSKASTRVEAAPHDALFPAFSVTESYWILIHGNWRVDRRVAGIEKEMFTAHRPGTWTGGIPVIDKIAPPRATVLTPSLFLRVPSEAMDDLAAQNPSVAARLLSAVNWGSGHIGGLLQPAAA